MLLNNSLLTWSLLLPKRAATDFGYGKEEAELNLNFGDFSEEKYKAVFDCQTNRASGKEGPHKLQGRGKTSCRSGI